MRLVGVADMSQIVFDHESVIAVGRIAPWGDIITAGFLFVRLKDGTEVSVKPSEQRLRRTADWLRCLSRICERQPAPRRGDWSIHWQTVEPPPKK